MTAFKEHFLAKYFAYRRRYVDHIVREAPHRGPLAVTSELARLAFEIAGNGLCASILWALAFGAAARPGGPAWPAIFGALACVPTTFAGLSIGGFVAALRDRSRVQERSDAAAKARTL